MPADTKYLSWEFMNLIADQKPECMQAYLTCISNADDKGHCCISKKLLEEDICLSWGKFCNDIRKLARLGLLDFFRPDDGQDVVVNLIFDQNNLHEENSYHELRE
jgi:hypothetical protein